jgi:hypothetical protein
MYAAFTIIFSANHKKHFGENQPIFCSLPSENGRIIVFLFKGLFRFPLVAE